MPKKKQADYEVIATEGNGGIKLVCKNNIYYLKFPSQICRAVWNQPQKLLSIGLKVNSKDASADAKFETQARAIWNKACEDAKSKTGYETIKANYTKYNYKNIFRLIGDDREKCPSLYEICSKWFYEHKVVINRLEETTKEKYKYHLKEIQSCPQDLFNLDEIKNWLVQKSYSTSDTTKRLLLLMRNALKWGTQKKLIPEYLNIDIESWKQDITRITDKQCPLWAKEKGYFKPNQEHKGFSVKDEETILDAFKKFQWRKQKPGWFYPFVKLKFLTGCRPGEGLALRWSNFDDSEVNEDEGRFGILHFQESFSKALRNEKSIKNHKPHQLPCDRELANFLFEIRPTDYKLSDYIIEPELTGIARSNFFQYFSTCWAGHSRKIIKYNQTGILEKLLDEKKLVQLIYRSPYATRHTFITRQINAGVPLGTVAAWVGDDPATIAKHYLGADSTRVPMRPNTTNLKPTLSPPSSPSRGFSSDALVNYLQSELEAQKKVNADLQKRLDEKHQLLLKLSS
jgi:integrase